MSGWRVCFVIVPVMFSCALCAPPNRRLRGRGNESEGVGRADRRSSNGTSAERTKALGSMSISASSASSWVTIGDQVSDQIEALEWQNADGSKGNLKVLGTSLSATFDVIAALQAGGSFDETFLAVGGAVLPLIKMANPFLGFASGLFLGLFNSLSHSDSPDLAEVLQDLYDRIMEDVQNMITEAFADEAYSRAKTGLSSTSLYLLENPITDMSYGELLQMNSDLAKYDFVDVFYASECLNEDLTSPKDEPTSQCIDFQRRGAVQFQVSFAALHLNILLELARGCTDDNAECADRDQKMQNVVTRAQLYSRLLRASLDSWKLHSADSIPNGEYDYPSGWGKSEELNIGVNQGLIQTTTVSKCPGCGDSACTLQVEQVNPYSGENIPEKMGCSPEYTYCQEEKNRRRTTGRTYDISFEGQYVFALEPTSRRRRKDVTEKEYPDGMCSESHYSTYLVLYRKELEDTYGPLIYNMSQVSVIV